MVVYSQQKRVCLHFHVPLPIFSQNTRRRSFSPIFPFSLSLFTGQRVDVRRFLSLCTSVRQSFLLTSCYSCDGKYLGKERHIPWSIILHLHSSPFISLFTSLPPISYTPVVHRAGLAFFLSPSRHCSSTHKVGPSFVPLRDAPVTEDTGEMLNLFPVPFTRLENPAETSEFFFFLVKGREGDGHPTSSSPSSPLLLWMLMTCFPKPSVPFLKIFC